MWRVENLNIWKKSIELSKQIYKLTLESPWFRKDLWLKDQIQRSSVSIASNIAEWNDRETNAEFLRFLFIARWSISELKTQLIIASEIWYIDKNDFENILENSEELHKMINGFIKTLKK